jgi:hypothetical protein
MLLATGVWWTASARPADQVLGGEQIQGLSRLAGSPERVVWTTVGGLRSTSAGTRAYGTVGLHLETAAFHGRAVRTWDGLGSGVPHVVTTGELDLWDLTSDVPVRRFDTRAVLLLDLDGDGLELDTGG